MCMRVFVNVVACVKIIIIINKGSKSRGGDITPSIFLAHTPAGAESDLNAAAAAPSQTEVTNLNCSDHSTTSKRNGAWRALVSLHLTRIQDPTLRYKEVVEWSEQLRSVPSIWLGAAAAAFKSDSAPAGV